MSVNVGPTSRLLFDDLLIIGGIEHWDTLDLPEIPPQPGDLDHLVTGSDRIDIIAYRYYKDPVLWWCIAKVNGLEIFPTDLKVGSTITVPDPDFILSRFLPQAVP